MLIRTKKALHRVIDEMIDSVQDPVEIGICTSYIEYDIAMSEQTEYRGIKLTYIGKWFAQGKIKVR